MMATAAPRELPTIIYEKKEKINISELVHYFDNLHSLHNTDNKSNKGITKRNLQ